MKPKLSVNSLGLISKPIFLLTAENEALLLEKDAKLSKQLAQRNITFKSLSQWISPLAEQEQLAEYLQHISADDYAVLNDIVYH